MKEPITPKKPSYGTATDLRDDGSRFCLLHMHQVNGAEKLTWQQLSERTARLWGATEIAAVVGDLLQAGICIVECMLRFPDGWRFGVFGGSAGGAPTGSCYPRAYHGRNARSAYLAKKIHDARAYLEALEAQAKTARTRLVELIDRRQREEIPLPPA